MTDGERVVRAESHVTAGKDDHAVIGMLIRHHARTIQSATFDSKRIAALPRTSSLT